MKGLVIKSAKREFECIVLETKEKVVATAYGNLLKGDETLVVGDKVELKKEDNGWIIEKLHDRKNELFRHIIRENKKKVTASNVDFLVVLTSVSKPIYKRGIIDRFLVRAAQWGIQSLVVFNKMDQFQPDSFNLEFETKRLSGLAECFEISAKEPSYEPRFLKDGIIDLKKKLEGSVSIFVGQSGVGKSHTISSLSEGKFNLRTKTVSKKSGKGSHTTTWSEIVDCGDFYLIDSPGIRSLSLDDLQSDGLIEYFPDLEQIAVQCKFNNCGHEANSKGCAFLKFRDEESLHSKIIISRLESFLRVSQEVSEIPDWKK